MRLTAFVSGGSTTEHVAGSRPIDTVSSTPINAIGVSAIKTSNQTTRLIESVHAIALLAFFAGSSAAICHPSLIN